jgi:uncharacterized phage protein gp47/JayE
MTIEIKSYNEILGAMIRKIVADTSLNDINTGSALLTLLEAAAQVDFENNAAILSVLELLSIDATRNVDLDARGADFGLTRINAQRGTGIVTIGDSGITKRSTGLYQVKLPPISGSTTIFVNDASDWNPTGSLFIGRGTAQFEGPINYTSIINNGTFFTIALGSALDKDHLISDVVIDSQGTANRLIAANTTVSIPANNLNPSVEFKTLRDAVIASGEDSISGIDIISVDAGNSSNAGINTIAQYVSLPFPTATVINTTAITNARDVETDEQFRERVKAFTSTLARGTKLSILSAIIGISDTTDNKQVASAVITEPPKVGDPSILYMDDGSGFQPTFEGQSVDVLVKEATGTEEFLQLANFPLPRPQALNTIDGPFEITSNSLFTVIVDGVDETVVFTDSQFLNPASATLSEIIVAANSQSTLWKIRFHEDSSRLLIEPTAHDAETIQVAALSEGASSTLYANDSLKFPTNEFSHIKLYQNNTLLREKEKSATLTSSSYTTWNIVSDGTLVLSVDGTPAQSQSFSPTDFGNTPYLALELADWVEVVNNKFAGITATATSTGAMQIVSNQEGISSSLDILSGSYLGKMFAGKDTSAVGQSSDFELNRQNGNLRILTDIAVGDSITAGSADTKGQALSLETATGNYAVGTDGSSRPAQVVVMADSDEVVIRAELGFSVGSQLEITINGDNEMRLMGDTASAFSNIQAGDFIYIADRGAISSWIDSANTGIFKVVAKGGHTQAPVGFPSVGGDDTYIDIRNINAVAGVHTVEAIEDIQAFRSNRYPQIWEGDLVATPAAAPIQDIVDSINANLLNVEASIFKTNAVQLTSSTETGGSVATPVSIGNATGLFATGQTEQTGNLSHVANRAASQDMSSFFKRTTPTSTDADGILGKTVWLDRYTYTDTKGLLTDNAEPEVLVPGSPNEILESTGSFVGTAVEYDDVLTMVSGQNKELYRSIREFLPSDTLGTQQTLPRTVMDYYINDEWTLFRPAGVNAEDSIVFIMDQDSVSKTVDIRMSRTGRVNSLVPPTDFSFSANDEDNEAGITFGTLQVWSKTTNKTEFSDYAIWMRARNWYESGGAGSGGGSFMVRAIEYGPHGENYRFRTEYPSIPGAVNTISHNTFPDYTMNTYGFGSGPAVPTSIAPGDLVAVSNPSLNIFRYTFPLTVDLSAIVPGNIISISDEASFSAANSGVFRVDAVNDVTKIIDVHNPNGAITVVGTPNEETVTTVDDIVGNATVSNVTVTADIAGASDSTYFIIDDEDGLVAVWYRVTDGANTPNPGAGALSVNRVLEVPILSGALAISVAASTSGVVGTDSKFTAAAGGTDTVTITDTVNGAFAAAVDGGTPTSYGFAGVVGTPDTTIDGTYFIVPDGINAGDSVAIWYDLTGLTAEPLHGASRSIEITTVAPGDTAATIASKTAVFLAADGAWTSATVIGSTITLINSFNGAISAVSAGTSTFTVISSVTGTSDVQENVALATGIKMYPLINTAVADIVAKINESDIIVATEISGAGLIEYATRDEVYTPALVGDYADALGFEHDPDPVSGNNGSIGLYDSIDWIKDYQNTNPHFALKRGLQLQGVPPTATYSLDSTPNEDATIGEMFKLVPTTVTNMLHHFTHKALSQLPIVADVNISNNMRKIQIKSQQLGSGGAVEVVGGNANDISYSIFGEGQTATGAAGDKILVRTAAFPVSLTAGDYVTVGNDLPAVRKNTLQNTDSIDVTATSGGEAIYAYNPKETFINQFVSFDITDVSALYARTAGTVWRWTHDSAGSVVKITDKTLGSVATPPDAEIATGGGVDAPALEILNQFGGSATVEQTFDLTVSSAPLQADYFTFESLDGNKFAVWFSIDVSPTEPTGATYLAVPLANRIQADYASGASLNQIAFSVAAAISANVPFSASFDSGLLSGATFGLANPGDILMSGGMITTSVAGEWKNGNAARITGDGNVSGFPIIAVNAVSSYVDVVNPAGQPLSGQPVGATGSVNVCPTPVLEWALRHSARSQIIQSVVSAGTATVTTATPHGYNPGDLVSIIDNSSVAASPTAVTVISVDEVNLFTFTTAELDTTYAGGSTILDGEAESLYKIESLGFNDLYRLKALSGSPGFTDCGAAVDDILAISGSTFASNNSGRFRILGVDNDSIIYQNVVGSEELNTLTPFNDLADGVNWTSNSDLVTGAIGNFKNISIGDWVKKPEDSDSRYLQVTALLNAVDAEILDPALATQIVLGSTYGGTTSQSVGTSYNQAVDYEAGIVLQSTRDIRVYNVDSVEVGDTLFIDNISNDSWYSTSNSGTFTVTGFGTDADLRPVITIDNSSAVTETDRRAGVSLIGFSVIEGENSKFESIRKVEHISIDELNPDRRRIYMTPPTQVNKFSESSETKLKAFGKLGYSTDITTGVDGYKYYTGLLRTVQRIVDGFEPDQASYPGRRAVGGAIEILPPLIKRVSVSVDVTTAKGVNLNEISNDIKSAVINYVNNRGVGDDVILADIIVRIMNITGVAAVTFNTPAPSTERIAIADNEKSFIEPTDISVA